MVYRSGYNDPESPRIQPLAERPKWESDSHYRAADDILAAGYSKPRTITTVAELDALTQGTKLYSSKTTHSWHLNDLSHPHGGTRVQGTGGGYTYPEDFIKYEAPLVVLYEPAQ